MQAGLGRTRCGTESRNAPPTRAADTADVGGNVGADATAGTTAARKWHFAAVSLEAAIGVEPMMEVLQSGLAENGSFYDLL
jgi:hypothetical protein